MLRPQTLSSIHLGSVWTAVALFVCSIATGQTAPRPASQNPSPMVEYTRKHERILQEEASGLKLMLDSLLPKPIQVFIPKKSISSKEFDLLVHFHGAEYVVQHAASRYDGNLITATVNLGSGSRVYNDAFQDTLIFTSLRDSIAARAGVSLRAEIRLRRVFLSGFSAGYGAIRKIISTPTNYAAVDAVLLLDGLHTSYLPDGKPLAEGGRIDSTGLLPFLRLVEDASQPASHKRFLITHSEIFPGTFVSTTEASDFILRSIGLTREPVLTWGPLGMQQLSLAHRNHFTLLGFAGNAAPDHIDHFHALSWFLDVLLKL